MSDDESDSCKPGVTSGRRIVTLAMMLAMAVAALEQTVVSPAMPTIIASLRGVEIYPWVFSAYLLAATVTTPLYGKLADLFGRKRVLLFGLSLFMLGSALSGMAWSMVSLIGFRVLQGLGAGAVAPIVLILIADIYTLEERAKFQGLFSGIWGASSLAGPALGGWLTDSLSWRWVFFVTVPFATLSAVILLAFVRESVARKEVKPIDWTGAGLLMMASSLFLIAVLGGEARSWRVEGAMIALAVAVLFVFDWNERRAADPILPHDLLLRPTIAAAILGNALIGVLVFGVDTYVPLYVQGVLGGSARDAGMTLTPMFLTWSISVAIAAKLVVRFGFRRAAMTGTVLLIVGSLAIVLGATRPSLARPCFFVGTVLLGMGMGPTALSYILSVQNSVSWERRGVATGAVTFFRTMGGALGVGVLGATLGYELASRLAGLDGLDITAALRPETHSRFEPEQLRVIQAAIGLALRDVFLQMSGLSALGLICASKLPHRHAAVPHATPEPQRAESPLAATLEA